MKKRSPPIAFFILFVSFEMILLVLMKFNTMYLKWTGAPSPHGKKSRGRVTNWHGRRLVGVFVDFFPSSPFALSMRHSVTSIMCRYTSSGECHCPRHWYASLLAKFFQKKGYQFFVSDLANRKTRKRTHYWVSNNSLSKRASRGTLKLCLRGWEKRSYPGNCCHGTRCDSSLLAGHWLWPFFSHCFPLIKSGYSQVSPRFSG